MTSTMRTHAHAPDSTRCHSVRSLMEAFVDGELSPEQTLEMEAHVEHCPRCQANADFQRVLSSSIRELVHAEPPREDAGTRRSDASRDESTPGDTLSGERQSEVNSDASKGVDAEFVAEAVLSDEQATNTVAISPFMLRLEQAIDAEIEREAGATQGGSHNAWVGRSTWVGRITVFAAAASATLWFGVRTFGPEVMARASGRSNAPAQARDHEAGITGMPVQDDEVMTLEGALDRLIDYHSSPPRPQVTSADLLPELEPDVGVRMQLPKLDASYGARWEGASLVPVRNQRAASFRYQLPKNKVTLYVFNASRLRVQDSRILIRESPQPVYFGQWRGYNVAAKENRGVGYALATDMDGPAVARMINDVH